MRKPNRVLVTGFLIAAAFGLIALLPIPAFSEASGYGYLVSTGPKCAVWWAEGAYKVMREDPVPAAERAVVRIAAARNEYEPFLLVLRPATRLDGVRVAAGPLTNEKGAQIGPAGIAVCHVGYVNVTTPTDAAGKAGWWPDPLPPYDGPFAAAAGENHPLWITVRVPKDAAPGVYKGEVALSAGGWSCIVPVELQVRDFTLPDRSSVRSSFGLPAGDIKAYHNLETREELERVVDLYYQNMRDHRVAPTSPFELYPMEVETSGVFWKGGEFVTEGVHGGSRALKITDDTVGENVAAEIRRARFRSAILRPSSCASGPGRPKPARSSQSFASFSRRKRPGSRARISAGLRRRRRIGSRRPSSSPGLPGRSGGPEDQPLPRLPRQRRHDERDGLVRRHRPAGRAKRPRGPDREHPSRRRLRDAARRHEGRCRLLRIRPGRPPRPRRARLQRL